VVELFRQLGLQGAEAGEIHHEAVDV
jgi:hypothetical protein